MKSLGVIFVLLLAVAPALAHDNPSQLPPPTSGGEAWNVIEQSAANVDALLDAQLLRDVTFQLANSGEAIVYLKSHAADAKDAAAAARLSDVILDQLGQIILAIRSSASTGDVRDRWRDYRGSLAKFEALYPAATVKSDVFICPMHPLDRHTKADDRCTVCMMHLVRRNLPASSVFQRVGAATMKIELVAPQKLAVNQPAEVRFRLLNLEGSPITFDNLLEVHTKKIHLLINDRALGDYHHEHPTPTPTPGEYAFIFTPAHPGPYRMWADVVPSRSSAQEYIVANLPAEGDALPLSDRATKLTSVVDGRTYTLSLNTDGKPIRARQTIVGAVEVTDADGKPFTRLEPVMGAFAHIVGFSEDLHTVVHIHPYGKEPTSAADRAGPAFAFKFYAPTSGFMRLYVQVQIDGKQVFAPLGVNVEPAEEK